MKRIFFFLFMLTAISNFSYASFPVLENVKQDSIKYSTTAAFSESEVIIYYVLGFIVGFLSFILFFLPLFFLFSPNKAFRKGIYIGLVSILTVFATVYALFSIFSNTELVIM